MKMLSVLKRKGSILHLLLLFVSVLALVTTVQAAAQQKKGKNVKPVGAVNSSNGGVYNPGEYGVILKYITFTQDQLYSGSDEISFVRPVPGMKPGKKPYEKTLQKYQLTLRTGILNDFDARLVIPFFDKGLERKSFKAQFDDDNTGFGDITLFGRYRILSQKKKDPFNLAFGLGLEMPTGETDVEDSVGKTPGYLQPGGGSWNPVFEIGAHKVKGPHWFGSHLLYKNTTEGELGAKDFERPDVFKYNLSYGYALSSSFDLQLEVNGEVKSKAELEGKKQKNSGGHLLFLSPGLHFKFYKGMHMGLCVPLTVYRDLNGEQLSEDFRVIGKLALKF